MPATEKNANAFDMTTLSAVNSGYSLMLINNSTNEGQLITMTDLATMILNEIRNQTFTATELGQSSASTLPAAISSLNSALSNVKSIAEKATHSPNLTPFGSRSFDDANYWMSGFTQGGYVGQYGTIYSTEQLADGWIHVVIDNTAYTGTSTGIGDDVWVRSCPSVKPGQLYTFLFEVRNNHSTFSATSGDQSYFYIMQSAGHQFYGADVNEVLENNPTGTSASFVLRRAPDPNTVYRRRFTKFADDGTHTGSGLRLVRIPFRVGAGDYLDYEVRISLYEGRYLGDYMPYVISDVTDLKKTATTTTNGLMSAQDKQKLDNL